MRTASRWKVFGSWAKIASWFRRVVHPQEAVIPVRAVEPRRPSTMSTAVSESSMTMSQSMDSVSTITEEEVRILLNSFEKLIHWWRWDASIFWEFSYIKQHEIQRRKKFERDLLTDVYYFNMNLLKWIRFGWAVLHNLIIKKSLFITAYKSHAWLYVIFSKSHSVRYSWNLKFWYFGIYIRFHVWSGDLKPKNKFYKRIISKQVLIVIHRFLSLF